MVERPSPEFLETVRAVIRPPDPDQAFVADLFRRLEERRAQLSKPSAGMAKRQARGVFAAPGRRRVVAITAIVVMLLVAAVLVIGPQRVLAAARSLFGFIPGVGFVEDVHSVLEEPVVVRPTTATGFDRESPSQGLAVQPPAAEDREGITVTVEEVVVEGGRTVLVYRVTGLPPDMVGADRGFENAGRDGEAEADHIRLADGSILHMTEGRYQYGSDTQHSALSARLVFPPLPEGANEFTLVIPRFEYALPGELPENWSIPIRLVRVEPAQVLAAIDRPNLASQPIRGITLRLLKVAQTPNQTAFQLALGWEGVGQVVHHTAPVTLRDSQGRYYILTAGPEAGEYTSENPNFSTLPTYVTTAVSGNEPVTLSLDWVMMSATGQASFTFDPGRNPQIGQEWSLDEDLLVGGYPLRVTAARLKPGEDGQVVLEFDLEAPDSVTGVSVIPVAEESGVDHARDTLVSRLTLAELPTGPLELRVSEVRYRVDGPWQITWQPQAIDFSGYEPPAPVPTRLPGPTPTFVPGQPLLPEIAALLERAYGPYQRGPGWVHVVQEVHGAGDVSVLDTGDLSPQPLEYISERWLYLDAEGNIRISVAQIKSPDGAAIAAYLTNDTAHLNLPEGRGGLSEDLYLAPPSYDNDLLSILNWHLAEGRPVERTEAVLEGRRSWLLTATQEYDPPQVFVGEPMQVTKREYRVWVDLETGRILQSQSLMHYADRDSRVKDTTVFRLLERVETPPPEVLEILEQMILP